MSPEQVVGLEIGPPSDIFSLGAVLAFAGTGQAPFGVGSHAAILYRLVNSPPNLGQLPEEIRSLVGSCLAKHPSDRPAAQELLARVGAIQPAPGWLSEAIIYGSTEDQAAAEAVGLATAGSVISAAALSTAEPKSGIVARHARRRLPRAVTSAGITAGLVAASAAAVFALTGGAPQPLVPQTQSQTGGTAGSASHASLPPSPLASSHPAAPTPNAYLTPALSEFLTSSPPSRVLPTRSSAPTKSTSPSASPSGSASASPSPSVSESGSATPTPTPSETGSVPSPSDSPTPSPSDSGSPSPSPSDSASPSDSPSPSDSASASPSDSSTATPSPTSS
jgi:eukaryotic-like serine/threonine-protein kinase